MPIRQMAEDVRDGPDQMPVPQAKSRWSDEHTKGLRDGKHYTLGMGAFGARRTSEAIPLRKADRERWAEGDPLCQFRNKAEDAMQRLLEQELAWIEASVKDAAQALRMMGELKGMTYRDPKQRADAWDNYLALKKEQTKFQGSDGKPVY